MKIFGLIVLVVFMGCEVKQSDGGKKFAMQKLSFSPTILTEENPQRLQIIASGQNIRSLKKSLILLRYDGKDSVVLNGKINSINFIVKTLERSKKFELKPKTALSGGMSYGIYLCHQKICEIKHKFYIKRSLPKLVSHNFGQGEWPIIAHNRVYFEFKFDQPLFVPDEDSIRLITHDNKDLEITKIIVRPTAQEIEIEIKPGQLKFENRYHFEIGRVSNFDFREAHFRKQFIVGTDALPLEERNPVQFYVSSREIELSWHLSNDHKTDIFFGEENSPMNCLGDCSVEANLSSFQKNGFTSSLLVNNLKNRKKYNIIIRARDHQGKVILASGVVETLPPSEITLSEIYINPAGKGSDAYGEFLEYINFSNRERKLSNLRVIIEDNLSNKFHECFLVEKGAAINWQPHSYILIVGSDFKEDNFTIQKNTQIFRLRQKTLCGGLSDTRVKNIKLVSDQNSMLDRYKGHLWSGANGKSLQKRDIKGLDEERNYC